MVNLEAIQETPPKRGRSKYQAKRVFRTPDGVIVGDEYEGEKTKVADSRKEYRRLLELQELQRGGAISWLRTQVPFRLRVNNVLICTYWADAVYVEGGRQVVEDTKSPITRKLAPYRMKQRLMLALYGIVIREV